MGTRWGYSVRNPHIISRIQLPTPCWLKNPNSRKQRACSAMKRWNVVNRAQTQLPVGSHRISGTGIQLFTYHISDDFRMVEWVTKNIFPYIFWMFPNLSPPVSQGLQVVTAKPNPGHATPRRRWQNTAPSRKASGLATRTNDGTMEGLSRNFRSKWAGRQWQIPEINRNMYIIIIYSCYMLVYES